MSRALSRRAFLLATGAGLLGSRPRASEASRLLVEDWSAVPVGTRGVPPGWQKYETPGGHPAYDFTVVESGGRRALHMRSVDDHSTVAKEVRVDIDATPILAWQWRVISLPRGADLRKRATSDTTGHIFAIWPRFPAFARTRLIGYVWDATLPVGTVMPSRKTSAVTFIVARTGEQGLGQWLEERRNVVSDHVMVFGEVPSSPQAVALSIDTNDTRAAAETMFGRIEYQSS